MGGLLVGTRHKGTNANMEDQLVQHLNFVKKEKQTMEMDWNIFSAIFQAFGAIATFLAVLVALWQTKYANRKRLKLSFTEVSQIIGMKSGTVELATLTVSNIGNRAVTVQNW